MLQEALLGGVPCKAYAYVEVTLVELPADEHGHVQVVEGIRTWRGKAVVEDPAFLARWQRGKVVRYEGKLQDGEQERQISADVYVYFTRHARARRFPDRKAGEEGPSLIYVAFIGAGNTQIRS
jgi:hypothetical protein